MKSKPKVYVPNRGGHDFSDAERFGKVIFLSEGSVNRTAITKMYREMVTILQESSPDDFLVISGLNSQCSVASSILGMLHGKVNWLIFERGKYHPKTVVLTELLEQPLLFNTMEFTEEDIKAIMKAKPGEMIPLKGKLKRRR